jgi:hypothetical protein
VAAAGEERKSQASGTVVDRDLVQGAFGCCHFQDADHDPVAVRWLDLMRLVRLAILEVRGRYNR